MPELNHLYSVEDAMKYKKMTAYENLIEELTATEMVSDVNL